MDYLIRKILNSLEAGIPKERIAYYFDGKPTQLTDEILERGVICVSVPSAEVESITTGVTEQETFDVEIVVAKIIKNNYYKEGQQEAGQAVIRRIIEGSNDNGVLLTDTVRHIVRSNLKTWGVMQPSYSVDYDTQEFVNNSTFSATVTVQVIDTQVQQIN